ncbi:sensor histidine kinase [Phenylobacterium sp.]|uniref:sensor histidine kinase n=1 Tax=Phenylobacterium sp. TaxID=1871053 RepID=UPI0035B2974A
MAQVLYIDDDDGLRRLVSRRLKPLGFEITPAADGHEGVSLAESRGFDVIAIDHYMPGLDGLSTLEQIRQIAPQTPVIYVTGSEESRVAVAALKAGASDYVVKSTDEHFFDLLGSSFDQALAQLRLQTAKRRAEEALQETNRRLEALVARQSAMLAEVNHRVANSLQMVSALVRMQASALQDHNARAALVDTQSRIHAIGQVHRRLYTSDDVATVDLVDYLEGLARDLTETSSSPQAPRTVTLSGACALVRTDAAVSLGVIVAELVTNACKYAYAPDAPGEVRILISDTADGAVRLEVQDDGPGFDPGAAPRGSGLGSKVVRAMASNLRGELTLDRRSDGMSAILAFRP